MQTYRVEPNALRRMVAKIISFFAAAWGHISSTKKFEQFFYDILRSLFLQKVTAVERLSRHRRGRLLPPSSEHVPLRAHCALRAPQSAKWTLDLSAGFIVGLVQFQVNVRSGSEILTGSGFASLRRTAAAGAHQKEIPLMTKLLQMHSNSNRWQQAI
jgi:hypothetical protein